MYPLEGTEALPFQVFHALPSKNNSVTCIIARVPNQSSGRMSSEAEPAAAKAVFELAEKVDTFLCRLLPWHDGHAAAGEDVRISVSNSLPQDSHLNSNMGTIAGPRSQ